MHATEDPGPPVRFRGIQSCRNNKCTKEKLWWGLGFIPDPKINLPIMIGRTRDRRAGLVPHLLTSGLIPSLFGVTHREQISFRPGINPDLLRLLPWFPCCIYPFRSELIPRERTRPQRARGISACLTGRFLIDRCWTTLVISKQARERERDLSLFIRSPGGWYRFATRQKKKVPLLIVGWWLVLIYFQEESTMVRGWLSRRRRTGCVATHWPYCVPLCASTGMNLYMCKLDTHQNKKIYIRWTDTHVGTHARVYSTVECGLIRVLMFRSVWLFISIFLSR
jgi:hypothetical protein